MQELAGFIEVDLLQIFEIILAKLYIIFSVIFKCVYTLKLELGAIKPTLKAHRTEFSKSALSNCSY